MDRSKENLWRGILLFWLLCLEFERRSGTKQYSFKRNVFPRRSRSQPILSVCNLGLQPDLAFDFGDLGDLTSWLFLRMVQTENKSFPLLNCSRPKFSFAHLPAVRIPVFFIISTSPVRSNLVKTERQRQNVLRRPKIARHIDRRYTMHSYR